MMYPRNPTSSETVPSSAKNPTDDATISATRPAIELALPESGTAAWCAVFGAFLAQFCGFGYVNSFGVYQAFYSQQYLTNESSSSISWIGSLASFLGPVMGPVCGSLFDRGYFYHVWIGGAVLQSLSIFMLSLVKPGNYHQILLVQGLAYGIGLGLMYVPSLAIISHYFKRRRPAMMSIVASGAALGGIVHTIMLNKLLNGSVGFETGVRISAGFLTALLFLSCILVRPRYDALHHKAAEVSVWKAIKKCFVEIPSLFTIIGFTLYQTGYLYPFFYLQVDSLRHGLSTSFSFYTVVIVSAGSFFGRCVAGAILPFVWIVNLTILTTFACAVLITGMIWLGSVGSVVALGLLYGVFSGMNVGMVAPMLGLTSDPAELGVRIGFGMAIIGSGNLMGPPICGALLTSQYIWWRPALFSGAIVMLGSGFLLAVRFLLARAEITKRKCASGHCERPLARDAGTTSGRTEEESEGSATIIA